MTNFNWAMIRFISGYLVLTKLQCAACALSSFILSSARNKDKHVLCIAYSNNIVKEDCLYEIKMNWITKFKILAIFKKVGWFFNEYFKSLAPTTYIDTASSIHWFIMLCLLNFKKSPESYSCYKDWWKMSILSIKAFFKMRIK